MRAAVALTTVILAVMLACPAAAQAALDYGSHDISITLQPGEEMAYLFNMGAGDRLVVNLGALDGARVDFYLTNLTAYRLYSSGRLDSLYFLGGQSAEDAVALRYSYDTPVGNDYVLLIDNTANTQGGASPQGPVTVEGYITVEKNIWTLQNIAITVAVVAGIVLFMAYLRWPNRRK